MQSSDAPLDAKKKKITQPGFKTLAF